MISELINKFKGLWYGNVENEVEGYMIMTDSTNKKTLLLIKEGDKSWKTKWFSDNNHTYKAPVAPMTTIFNQ
jgi:hypothetical protein